MLLRLALAAALAPPEGGPGDTDFDGESTFRNPASFLHSHIVWRFVPARLDQVLKAGLRVDPGAFAFELLYLRAEQAKDERARRAIPVRRVDRADDRFQGAGEVAVPRPAARCFFATPKDDVVAEAETAGHAGECAAAHEVGAHARELAFAGEWVAAEELMADDHPEERIAEELEAFVGGRVGVRFVQIGGVREGLRQHPIREGLDREQCKKLIDGGSSSQRHMTSARTALPSGGREMLKFHDHMEIQARQSSSQPRIALPVYTVVMSESTATNLTCCVCASPMEAHMEAWCGQCNGSYHLNQRTDLPGDDCGQVWIHEEHLSLEFACNRCLFPESEGAGLDDVLDAAEAAGLVGTSVAMVLAEADAGRLRHRKTGGGTYLFERRDVLKLRM